MRWTLLFSLALLPACASSQTKVAGEIDAWGSCASKCKDTGDDLAAHSQCEEDCAAALEPGRAAEMPGPGEDALGPMP